MLEELKARLREHEGVVPHLYLDTLGLVTCGVGHMIPSPNLMAGIPMAHSTGLEASLIDKVTEWYRVKALEPARLPAYYAANTSLRMTPEAITALQDEDVDGFRQGLRSLLPGFDQFPETAQEALLDMAFQLGAMGLIDKFPHLVASVKAHDWQTCAVQCHRAGIQEWRNVATANLFRQAAEPSVPQS
jgi:GH24 family phage-related lysozyme (muramidase)